MGKANHATSFDEFLAADERLLDTEIMLSHYKKKTLFSDKCKTRSNTGPQKRLRIAVVAE
jgi:hypothetical protein